MRFEPQRRQLDGGLGVGTKAHQSDVEESPRSKQRSSLLGKAVGAAKGPHHIGLVVSFVIGQRGWWSERTDGSPGELSSSISRRYLSALIATSSALGGKSGH